MAKKTTHKGGCHCGNVRFEFGAPAELSMTDCNCSMCAKSGFQHVFVPHADFKVVSGADNLTIYKFNTCTAKHLFCRQCGVKSFYQPRSHPDQWSVNYRCIDTGTLAVSKVITFDGQNFDDNIEGLREKT